MKKLILFLGILCMSFTCAPDEYYSMVNYGVWAVKNNTNRTLILRPGVNGLKPYSLVAGGTVQLHSNTCEILKIPVFQSLLNHSPWNNFADENIHFEVLSADGTPLAKWSYTDRDSGGRQFFNESSWTVKSSSGDRDDEIRVTWYFEITQEDIR